MSVGGSKDLHIFIGLWQNKLYWRVMATLLEHMFVNKIACASRCLHHFPCVTRRVWNWRRDLMMWRLASPPNTRAHAAARAPFTCGTGTTKSLSLTLMAPSPSMCLQVTHNNSFITPRNRVMMLENLWQTSFQWKWGKIALTSQTILIVGSSEQNSKLLCHWFCSDAFL